MKFSVSVIIPVYNCERFIEKAINSAVLQAEVSEIVVVDDGSTDGSLLILEQLALENPIIKVYHHKNKVNKGRSASRNLALQKATQPFIAFLDADDYFLPNRFTNDKKIFHQNNLVDGVYNAIGAHFYRNSTTSIHNQLELTTISENVNPEKLFDILISGKKGHFSIDGLTIKKSVFDKIGFFNEDLIVAEDTDVIWKMALKCKLIPGVGNLPLAMRGVHENNVSNREDLYKIYSIKMYESLFFWSNKQQMGLKTVERFLERIWILKFRQNNSIIKDTKYWLFLTFKSPRVLFSYLTVKYFPLVRLRKRIFPFLYKQ